MLYLKNLRSSEIFSGVLPWEFTKIEMVPEQCFADKAARDAWINDPKLDFHVYTLYEGTQANLRLRGDKGEEDANEPAIMHGLAVDYDSPITPEMAKARGFLGGKLKPTWFEQTLSGHGRLLWLFETPIRLPSRKFTIELLKFISEKMKLVSIFPGFDEPAFLAPERYFTNGCRWTPVSDNKIPSGILEGWLRDVASQFEWADRQVGKPVDIQAIAEECARKYPKFAQWPGEFKEGASGPTFWIEESASIKSAIVKATGIYTFSGSAPKPFYTWSELVGAEFVEQSETAKFGNAIKDVYYDGKNYFFLKPNNKYAVQDRSNLELWLRDSKRLSSRKIKGEECTEVEKAINYINNNSAIDAAASCAFFPKGVITYNGVKILNTHVMEVVQPAPDPTVWGPDGKFPFSSRFFDQLFTTREQLEIFLARWIRSYRGCYERNPVSGHAIIIAGPQGSGKTLATMRYIGDSHGGSIDAGRYLVKGIAFNAQMFDYPVWRIDDGSAATNEPDKQNYTERLKSAVANPEHYFDEKFRKAGMVPWKGLITITCNTDPLSIRMIPNNDSSNRDKLIVLRAAERTIEFFESAILEPLIAKELPYLLRWLLDWTPPAHVFKGSDVRFGIREFFEPSLLSSSNQSSPVNSLAELLDKWFRIYFSEMEPTAEAWTGTGTDLMLSMSQFPVFTDRMRTYRSEYFAQLLLQIHAKQIFKMDLIEDGDSRQFIFYRNGRFGKPKSSVGEATPNSKFEKV